MTDNSRREKRERREARRKAHRKACCEIRKRLISINEFVETYSVGRSKTYELIRDGTLLSVCIGKRRLIVVDSAEALVAAA